MNRSFLIRTLPAALVTALTVAAPAAQALPQSGLTNGDFRHGSTGWSTAGDVAALHSELILSTASTLYEDDYPLPVGALNVSGTGALDNWFGDLDTAAGVAPGLLGAGAALEGSVAWQSFNVHAGDRLSLRYNLRTADGLSPDLAFVAFGGQAYTLATADQALLPTGAAHQLGETGWQTWSFTFTQAGTVRLAVGVADLDDAAGTSTLLVDDVSVTPVPEPQSVLMMLAGLGVMALVSWRMRSGR